MVMMNMMTRMAAYTSSGEVTAHHDHDIIPVSFKTRNTRGQSDNEGDAG